MLDDQIFCPTCGTDTDHSLIKSGQENLVRCIECDTVHSIQVERERLVNLKVIVNRDRQSSPYFMNFPAREILHVGDELLVDDPAKEVVMTEITSLETDRRVQAALAGEVGVVWARATDEVPLKISVYRSGTSHSLKISVSGDEVFEVGETRQAKGCRFSVVKIKLRGEGFADFAPAKDIVRIWGREI
ncbi:MAG TPA: HVO_0476 family zinc finger protein [Methanothrix sp.]|nr:HVO_0476 family zinc finger protein [Methanothrix sp.]HPT18584.1 HVO_0476 family zinc finger protein [Methanothrix sp.]